MYSIIRTCFYQGSSARGAAGTWGAWAGAALRAGGGAGAQGRTRSRGVGRASGAPFFSLPSARSASLPAFRSGGGRRRGPFPPHTLGTAAGRAAGARCGEAEAKWDEADWGGWTHKESWPRASATRDAHRGQRRVRMALTRAPRPKCGCRVGFLRWVAEAAPVAVVVCTGPPSRSTIAAPLPRSPASGVAWRQGFGLDTCWRRGALGVPAAAAGTHGCHRPLRSTQPAPLLRHDGGAPLSTTARSRGWRRPPFMSALGGGGGRQQSQRRGGGGGGHSSGSPGAPSAGRRSLHTSVVRAHGPLLLSSPIAGSPPTPPIRVAPSAMPRSPARPGHSFPSNLTPPCRPPQPHTNTHTLIDETHVRYI